MSKSLLFSVLACVLVAATACANYLPVGESGSVAMLPFMDQERGIRGNAPLEGWSERAALVQESVPGSREAAVAVLIEKTDLVQLPRSTGTFKGAYLTWDLYTFGTRIAEAGPDVYHVDLALAQGKGDTRQYLVVLIAQPMDYVANQAMYRTVFEHALYAFEPLD